MSVPKKLIQMTMSPRYFEERMINQKLNSVPRFLESQIMMPIVSFMHI